MVNTKMTAALMKRIRLEKKLTQVKMAKELGISQSMLCKLEKGQSLPALPAFVNLGRLAKDKKVFLNLFQGK